MINLNELIKDTSKLDETTLPELKELTERYPFYQVARLLYITNLFKMHSPSFGAELRKASVFIPDRTSLFLITEGSHYELDRSNLSISNSIETEDDSNRTMSLIETFLSQTVNEDGMSSTPAKDRPSIADVTNDYATFLMTRPDITPSTSAENSQPKLRGEDLINSFIEETKGRQRIEMSDLPDDYLANEGISAEEQDFQSPEISDKEEEIYTENMVNIYVRQGKYEQALEILRKICLNNPQKSSNFATQIRLLEDLIRTKKA